MTSLEVTTISGCPGNCLKYCAQEVFLKRYGDRTRTLKPDDWHRILHNIPCNVPVWFAGFSEPLVNPDFIKLAKSALNHGHKISLYTTLFGSSNKQIDELVKLKFEFFMLHLVDGKVLKTPNDPDYPFKVIKVLTEINNVRTVQMNDNFKSCRREDSLRGNPPKPRKVAACSKNVFADFQPIMTPDGQVYPCCMDMGLNYPMGSLLEQNWNIITTKIRGLNPTKLDICRFCVPYGLTRTEVSTLKAKGLMRRIFNLVTKTEVRGT
jgi:hypothetical protein